MPSPRATWTLVVVGSLALGALLFLAPLLWATTTTPTAVSVMGGGGTADPRCAAAIERAGEPLARWSRALAANETFEIPVPDGVPATFGLRIEVLGTQIAPSRAPPGMERASWPTSTMECRWSYGDEGARTLGAWVAQGEGAVYAAYWRI